MRTSSTAVNRCQNTLHALSLHLALSLKSRSALHCWLIVHGLPCGSCVFVLSQTLCFIVTYSVVMLPRYFEYNIERGPGNSRVEWIRVYTPGMWQPVAESTLGPAPDHASTHREWRRVYHFDVYWPRDSTGGPTADALATPVSYASYHTWQFRDWHTRGYQCLGDPRPYIGSTDFVPAGLSSSSVSSVPDGAWREPSPHRATILILTGMSDIDALTECCLKHCAC